MADFQLDATETDFTPSLTVSDKSGAKTGLTVTMLVRAGGTELFLDFSDNTFKASGHSNIDGDLVESTLNPGEYIFTSGLDISALTLPAGTTRLYITYVFTGGTPPIDGTAQDTVTIRPLTSSQLVEILQALKNRRRIAVTGSVVNPLGKGSGLQWQLLFYEDDGSTIKDRKDLFDINGVAINDFHNPILDISTILADEVPV